MTFWKDTVPLVEMLVHKAGGHLLKGAVTGVELGRRRFSVLCAAMQRTSPYYITQAV